MCFLHSGRSWWVTCSYIRWSIQILIMSCHASNNMTHNSLSLIRKSEFEGELTKERQVYESTPSKRVKDDFMHHVGPT